MKYRGIEFRTWFFRKEICKIIIDILLESNTQECKHSGRLGDREEKEGGGGETE